MSENSHEWTLKLVLVIIFRLHNLLRGQNVRVSHWFLEISKLFSANWPYWSLRTLKNNKNGTVSLWRRFWNKIALFFRIFFEVSLTWGPQAEVRTWFKVRFWGYFSSIKILEIINWYRRKWSKVYTSFFDSALSSPSSDALEIRR